MSSEKYEYIYKTYTKSLIDMGQSYLELFPAEEVKEFKISPNRLFF